MLQELNIEANSKLLRVIFFDLSRECEQAAGEISNIYSKIKFDIFGTTIPGAIPYY